MDELSLEDARRIALAAQGFGPRPAAGAVDARHIRTVLDHVRLLQLDSVNVLVRSHYLPVYSRLGPYPMDVLDHMAYRDRELFEFWAHRACLVPTELYPMLRWKMERYAAHKPWETIGDDAAAFVETVYRQVADRGPVGISGLDGAGPRSGWWGWSRGRLALEWLFASGRVSVSGRRNFERLYDLTERVLPPGVLTAPAPEPEEAQRLMVLTSAKALGVATAADLAGYLILPKRVAYVRVAELVADGRLLPVRVEGWRHPAYLHPEAASPGPTDARALLSPFDSLVWDRPRMQRLFGFEYTIEIYVPAAKRRYGYYVLPFLLGERLVARVDLKADRKTSTLLARSVHVEPDADPAIVEAELGAEMRSMADWLGLERVE